MQDKERAPREIIKRATLRLCDNRDIDGIPEDEIAGEAGVETALLRDCYPDRKSLVLELLEDIRVDVARIRPTRAGVLADILRGMSAGEILFHRSLPALPAEENRMAAILCMLIREYLSSDNDRRAAALRIIEAQEANLVECLQIMAEQGMFREEAGTALIHRTARMWSGLLFASLMDVRPQRGNIVDTPLLLLKERDTDTMRQPGSWARGSKRQLVYPVACTGAPGYITLPKEIVAYYRVQPGQDVFITFKENRLIDVEFANIPQDTAGGVLRKVDDLWRIPLPEKYRVALCIYNVETTLLLYHWGGKVRVSLTEPFAVGSHCHACMCTEDLILLDGVEVCVGCLRYDLRSLLDIVEEHWGMDAARDSVDLLLRYCRRIVAAVQTLPECGVLITNEVPQLEQLESQYSSNRTQDDL